MLQDWLEESAASWLCVLCLSVRNGSLPVYCFSASLHISSHVSILFYNVYGNAVSSIYQCTSLEYSKLLRLSLLFSSQAQNSLVESSEKLDLVRRSLELKRAELSPGSAKWQLLKRELESSQLVNPYSPSIVPHGPRTEQPGLPASPLSPLAASPSVPLSKPASVTGQLQVRWASSISFLALPMSQNEYS